MTSLKQNMPPTIQIQNVTSQQPTTQNHQCNDSSVDIILYNTMVATRDIRSMIGSSGSNSNGGMTSLSTLKLVPPPLTDEFPNPSETRDDKEQSRSSRSDRRSKRDGGSSPLPKTPTRHRQGKSSSTSSNIKRQGRGDNASAVSRSNSKTRHSSVSNNRERSRTFPSTSNDDLDCETGAFDFKPLLGSLASGREESSAAINLPSSASALSKLLGTTSSTTTAPVNNMTTSPKDTSPKRMATNETDARATTTNPKVTIVGKAKVYSRILIPPNVYHSSATGLWISTINTSSRSSDDVKAFSFRTEQEARASAYANAPPVMISFDNCSECMLCDNKFSLLRRRKHCRNCGICICTNFSCR